jgi:hypothetical protein
MTAVGTFYETIKDFGEYLPVRVIFEHGFLSFS